MSVVQSRKGYDLDSDYAPRRRTQLYGLARFQYGLHLSTWVEYRFLQPIRLVRFTAGIITTVDSYLDDMIDTFAIGLKPQG